MVDLIQDIQCVFSPIFYKRVVEHDLLISRCNFGMLGSASAQTVCSHTYIFLHAQIFLHSCFKSSPRTVAASVHP